MPAKDAVISIRLPADLEARIAHAAEMLDLSKNDIARHALRAAVEAIEANDFHILLPLQMAVTSNPVATRPRKKAEPHPLAAIAAKVPGFNPPTHAIYANDPPADPNHPPSDAAGSRPTRTRRALRKMQSKDQPKKST